jgi:hypothetical protein
MKKLALLAGAVALLLTAVQPVAAQASKSTKKKSTKTTASTKKKATGKISTKKVTPAVATTSPPPPPPKPAPVAETPAAAPDPATEEGQAQVSGALLSLENIVKAKEQLDNRKSGDNDMFYKAGISALAPQISNYTATLDRPELAVFMTADQKKRYNKARVLLGLSATE